MWVPETESMERRAFVKAVTGSVVVLGGCTRSDSEDGPRISASVRATGRRCGSSRERVTASRRDDGDGVAFSGVLPDVPAGQTLRASPFGPAEDDSVICEVRTVERRGETYGGCPGSVAYTGEIRARDVEISEVHFIHTVDGDGEWVDTISA